MIVVIGGIKGGSGKTTVAGTLARILAEGNCKVLAIDGDPNPNLALMLGIEATVGAPEIMPIENPTYATAGPIVEKTSAIFCQSATICGVAFKCH